jgi:hypothetical protein
LLRLDVADSPRDDRGGTERDDDQQVDPKAGQCFRIEVGKGNICQERIVEVAVPLLALLVEVDLDVNEQVQNDAQYFNDSVNPKKIMNDETSLEILGRI